jgi:GH18 family chitinase
MKIFRITLIGILLFSLTTQNLWAQTNKEIVGYYPNWQWYDRSQLVNPEALFYEKYTVINYAFFRPMADGSIQSTDAWADENLLLGPMVWWPVQYHDSTKSLPYLCHEHGVKLLPSIGGWNDSYNFPGIAADPVKRQTFIDHCIQLIETYHFDGVDMDWEYPGYTPNGGTPQDKENFTTLMQELRDALDNLENTTGNEYLLTSCFGVAHERMENIEWENIVPLVDMVNLMSYDFHGSWDPESNHHTPLYSPAAGDPEWCIDGAFTKLTLEFDVPADMINIGIAFYGKALANCTGLYGPHTGYDASTFWEDEGQPLYYNILKNMNLFNYHWDDMVKCPYLLGNSINTFVTFDDPMSVGYKAQYVLDNNAKGIIIWEITGDYVETYPGSGVIEGTPLLDTIRQVFDFTTGVPPDITGFPVSVFPNPATGFITVKSARHISSVDIYTMSGMLVKSMGFSNLIRLDGFESGVYLFKFTGEGQASTTKIIVGRQD